MLEETPAFTRRCKHVIVVEYNATAQLAKLVVANGGDETHIQNFLKYDGTPMRAVELVEFVTETLNLKENEVA